MNIVHEMILHACWSEENELGCKRRVRGSAGFSLAFWG